MADLPDNPLELTLEMVPLHAIPITSDPIDTARQFPLVELALRCLRSDNLGFAYAGQEISEHQRLAGSKSVTFPRDDSPQGEHVEIPFYWKQHLPMLSVALARLDPHRPSPVDTQEPENEDFLREVDAYPEVPVGHPRLAAAQDYILSRDIPPYWSEFYHFCGGGDEDVNEQIAKHHNLSLQSDFPGLEPVMNMLNRFLNDAFEGWGLYEDTNDFTSLCKPQPDLHSPIQSGFVTGRVSHENPNPIYDTPKRTIGKHPALGAPFGEDDPSKWSTGTDLSEAEKRVDIHQLLAGVVWSARPARGLYPESGTATGRMVSDKSMPPIQQIRPNLTPEQRRLRDRVKDALLHFFYGSNR